MDNYVELNTESQWFIERTEYLERRQQESKVAQFKLDVVVATLDDYLNKSNYEVFQLIGCFTEEEDKTEIKRLSEITYKLLDKLTEKQLTILYMFIAERLTIQEIAERNGVTKQTIFKQLKSIQSKGVRLGDIHAGY